MIRLLVCMFVSTLWVAFSQSCAAEVPQHNKLKIGLIVPLSGNLAAYGAATRNGFELAVSEAAPHAYDQMEILYEDSRYDGTTTVSAFKDLVENKKVDLLYVWGDAPSEVIAPLAQRASVPVFAVSTDPQINDGRPWVVSYQASMADFGACLASYLNAQGHSPIAIIKTSLAFYLSMADATERNLASSIKVSVDEEVSPTDHDFRSLVARMRNSKSAAIGVFLMPGQISDFLKQARQGGLSARVFGTEDLSTRAEIDKVPALLEGAVFPGSHVSDQFLAKYVSKYNDDSHIAYAALSYEFAKYLPSLLRELESKTFSNEAIQAGLSSMEIVDGVLGHVERRKGPYGELTFAFPVVMRTIAQGRAADLK